MKTYRGYGGEENVHGGKIVEVDGMELNPRHDLRNHSPCGFQWGYGGSGPAQLALAILADLLGNDTQALMLYQAFKWGVIAALPQGQDWELAGDEIHEFIRETAQVSLV